MASTPFNNSKDDDNLSHTYARRMSHYGLGKGLLIPVSTQDMDPPCCGFFDRNADWNLISKLEYNADGQLQTDGLKCLSEPLHETTDITIAWKPKTSSGMTECAIDTSANTPNNVPGGADAHLKYSSTSKFGAILMCKAPVILKAYHQERAFTNWLDSNRHELYNRFGKQLRSYGLFIISKTYSTQEASINAWYNDGKEVLVSLAAKASMLGELGSTLSSKDTVLDKGWSHYSGAKENERVVVFADGINVKESYWWWKGIGYSLPSIHVSKSIDDRPPKQTLQPHRKTFENGSDFAAVRKEISFEKDPTHQRYPLIHDRDRPTNLVNPHNNNNNDKELLPLSPTTPTAKTYSAATARPLSLDLSSPLSHDHDQPRTPVLDDADHVVLQDAFAGMQTMSISRAGSVRSVSQNRRQNGTRPGSSLSLSTGTGSSLRAESVKPPSVKAGSLRRVSGDVGKADKWSVD